MDDRHKFLFDQLGRIEDKIDKLSDKVGGKVSRGELAVWFTIFGTMVGGVLAALV